MVLQEVWVLSPALMGKAAAKLTPYDQKQRISLYSWGWSAAFAGGGEVVFVFKTL